MSLVIRTFTHFHEIIRPWRILLEGPYGIFLRANLLRSDRNWSRLEGSVESQSATNESWGAWVRVPKNTSSCT